MKSEIESGSRPPPFDLKVLKSRPLFFLQVAGGRWPFRAIRGSSLRARLHERRGLQRAVPDLPPLHLRARALSRPSHPPPQLDAIRMRARTLTAFPHATETCLALFLADSSNRAVRLIPFGRIAAKVDRILVPCFEFFQRLATISLSLSVNVRAIQHGNFRMQSGQIYIGGMEILNNCRWNELDKNGMVTTGVLVSLFYRKWIDGNEWKS